MRFLTYGLTKRASISRGAVTESFRDRATFSASGGAKRVFLSYSSADEEKLPLVAALFEAHDAPCYVDRGDDRLPSPPSVETAAILREAIRATPRTVVFVTENTHRSRWVPWELGLADGLKAPHPYSAVLPFTASGSDEAWIGQFYLGLYPVVHTTNGTDWFVRDPRDGRDWTLRDWLHKSPT